MPSRKRKAAFVEPMQLQRTESLPEGPQWLYELKFDGYRAIAIKSGKVALRSRNDNDFSIRYPGLVQALASLPDETVIDGEVVALDETGKPSFNTLQNYGSSKAPVFYYVFDVPVLRGRDLMAESLDVRRMLLEKRVMPKLQDPIRCSVELKASLRDLVESVKLQGLEGLVAKRRDSKYEPGQRSGAWKKMRINKGREFVIGGYTPAGRSFDALIFGYHQDGKLLFAAKTRNGFTPASRLELMKHFRGLETPECPFANLPEKRSGRWGQGITAAKMKECRWLTPTLVGQFEFVEWTSDNHLRHSRFIALRDDKKPTEVVQER